MSDPNAEEQPPSQEGIYLDEIAGVGEQQLSPAMADPEGTSPSEPMKKSGIFGTSSNLVNTIVGVGIISVPYALKQSGLVAGIFLLILVAWMTDKSLRILIEAATCHPKLKHYGIHSYEELMNCVCGRAGSYLVLMTLIFGTFSVMVAYLIVIKDTVPVLLGLDDSLLEKRLVMLVASIVIILPICMKRDMAALALTSAISVSADIVLVGLVVALSPIAQSVQEAGGFWTLLESNWTKPSLFIGIGLLSTTLSCQQAVFMISRSLSNPTQSRWAAVTHSSLTLSTLMCLTVGICGYLGFLDDTESDILNNFPKESSVAVDAARALLAVTMFYSYPMDCFVARQIVARLFFDGNVDRPLHESAGESQGEFSCECLGRRHAITLGIFVATVIPAWAFSSVGTVLSLAGSISGSCLAYIAPGLIYLAINGDDFLRRANQSCDKGTVKASATPADLPVEGDPAQTIHVIDSDTPEDAAPFYITGQRPWWWWPAIMPLWCSVAATGVQQVKRWSEHEGPSAQEMASLRDSPPPPTSAPEGAFDPPKVRDYCVAVFFIVFGVVTGIAGVASNLL